MRVMFWNIQRLGGCTDEDRITVMKKIYSEKIGCDQIFLCELLQSSKAPLAYNLTYRRENPYQLCYGWYRGDGTDLGKNLAYFTPATTDIYQQAGYKGGNNFKNLSDRAVAYAGKFGKIEVFVFHAPAGQDNAVKAVSFLACDLHTRYGSNTRWIVLGDLNVEPVNLVKSGVGIDLSDYIRATDDPTKIGRTVDRYYDYVLCNFKDIEVTRLRCAPRNFCSDHYPILIDF